MSSLALFNSPFSSHFEQKEMEGQACRLEFTERQSGDPGCDRKTIASRVNDITGDGAVAEIFLERTDGLGHDNRDRHIMSEMCLQAI
jgi:hypothetical protein